MPQPLIRAAPLEWRSANWLPLEGTFDMLSTKSDFQVPSGCSISSRGDSHAIVAQLAMIVSRIITSKGRSST